MRVEYSYGGTVMTADSNFSGRGIFRPRRLGHINYWVSDVAKTASFYRDVAGLQTVYTRPGIKGYFLSNGNTYHDSAIFDVTGPRGEGRVNGMHHAAFELETEAELVEDYARIGEYGFEFDWNLSADVAHCCYGHDPEGNRFEVYADVKANWREERSGDIDGPNQNPDWQPGATPPVTMPCYPVDPEILIVEDAVFHTRRAVHYALIADDYDGLLDIYTKLVGLVPMAGGADHDFTLLAGSVGEASMALFRRQPGWDAGFHHGGFELNGEPAFERALKLCAERGIAIERLIEHGARRAIHIQDPCGNRLQFFVNGGADLGGLVDLPPEDALYLA
jgi:catechol 2,3-dioxygenase